MPDHWRCLHGHEWLPGDSGPSPPAGRHPVCPVCGAAATPRDAYETLSPDSDDEPRNPGSAAPAAVEALEPETLPPRPVPGGLNPSEAETLSPECGAANGETALPRVPGYELPAELGRGGMGVVYQARQMKLQRLVALKMVLAGAHAGPAELARFRTEAEAVARLQHPHIVQIYEVGEQQGLPFFSLEFCAGGSLAGQLDGTPWPADRAATLVETLARAMHAAHRAGVVHRDLKPANVLLTAEGQPKVTDFGLAKKLDDSAGPTQSGSVMGTPSYMAPEQAGGRSKEIGPTTDVYALGAVLYELLTGRPPFKATTPMDTLLQVLAEEPVPPSRVRSNTPRDLETICLKCLEKDAQRRYATAETLAEDLHRFQAGEPITARPVRGWERAIKWAKRRPSLAGLLGVSGLAVLALMAVMVGLVYQTQLKEQRDGADQQRERAEQLQQLTEENRQAAERERERADQNRLEAERRHERAEQAFHYSAKMNLAQRAWQETRVSDVLELLEQYRPKAAGQGDMRSFEWYYLWHLCHSDLRTFKGHTGPVLHVAFSPDRSRLASGSQDQTVKLWDTFTGQEVRTLKGHTGPVSGVAFSPDGQRLASGSEDRTAKLWDSATGRELFTLKGHTGGVSSVAFSPDGQRLASGSLDGSVKLWETATGQEVLSLQGRTSIWRADDKFTCVAFSPDGKRLASGSWNGTVRLWDSTTGQEVRTLTAHNDRVSSVAFSPDGERLASGSDDRAVKLWDAASGQAIHVLRGHTGSVHSVAFSPDGKRLASGGEDRIVRLWDSVTAQEILSLKGHTSVVRSVAFNSDGQRLASGSEDRMVKLWDAATGQEMPAWEGHFGSPAWSLAFSPDGQRLASGGSDEIVKLWDVSSGRKANTLRGFVAALDGQPVFVDLSTVQLAHTLRGHSGWVVSVAFSPDGKRLASGSHDKTIKLWDAASGREVLTLKGHTSGVRSVAFSPDGKRLASGSLDGTVKLWDTATAQEVLSLKGHRIGVDSVAFSPDGKRLASGSGDQTVRLWDSATGQELFTLPADRRWLREYGSSD